MLAGYVAAPVIRLAQLWTEFQQVGISMQRLGDILNTRPEIAGNLKGEDGNDTLSGGSGKDTISAATATTCSCRTSTHPAICSTQFRHRHGGLQRDDVSGMTTTGINVDLAFGTATKGLVGRRAPRARTR